MPWRADAARAAHAVGDAERASPLAEEDLNLVSQPTTFDERVRVSLPTAGLTLSAAAAQ
jgi:hypothetical protein